MHRCVLDLFVFQQQDKGGRLIDPRIYDEWEWTLEKTKLSKCGKSPDWDPSYKLCMKSKIPKPKTVTFEAKMGDEIDWSDPVFKQLDFTEDLMAAYRVPCSGDSGSGQMFLSSYRSSIGQSRTFKFVLAAIFRGRVDVMFDGEHKGKISKHKLPCGTYTYDPISEDYIQSLAISESISNQKMYLWVRYIMMVK